MTTPTTPAADAVSQAMSSYLRTCRCGGMPKSRAELVQSLVDDAERLGYFKAATARESALVAERDAYKAMVEDVSTEVHLLRAALVYIAEESDDMVALKCAQDALAAPAVEGE